MRSTTDFRPASPPNGLVSAALRTAAKWWTYDSDAGWRDGQSTLAPPLRADRLVASCLRLSARDDGMGRETDAHRDGLFRVRVPHDATAKAGKIYVTSYRLAGIARH